LHIKYDIVPKIKRICVSKKPNFCITWVIHTTHHQLVLRPIELCVFRLFLSSQFFVNEMKKTQPSISIYIFRIFNGTKIQHALGLYNFGPVSPVPPPTLFTTCTPSGEEYLSTGILRVSHEFNRTHYCCAKCDKTCDSFFCAGPFRSSRKRLKRDDEQQ